MKRDSFIREIRKNLWHFRHGGLVGLREALERRKPWGQLEGQEIPEPFNPIDVPTHEPTKRAKTFGDLRVAVIMDDFSLQAWGHEFMTVEVTPKNWREVLTQGVDLLFVESAWNGNHGTWQYQLTGPNAPSAAFRELVDTFREKGVPTVFWNKEDPPHFQDFLDAAKLFDVVFTSDSTLIDQYTKELGHDRVEALSFAAQPSIHNPVRDPRIFQRGDIAFAGMYFAHKYPERREQMDLLLGAAARVSEKRGYDFVIYSRFHGKEKKYQFPHPLDEHVVGSLPYDKMLAAYGAHKVFLNVNSVVDSPSMCARRVFEITASGTAVISTPSVALREFFPAEEVPLVADPQQAEWMIRALARSKELRDRNVHKAQRRIWNNHTYAHRASQVLRAAGLQSETPALARPSVTAMVSTNRPQQLEHVIGQVGQQEGVDIQLAIVSHGFEADVAELTAKAKDLGLDTVEFFYGDPDWTLGDCLNHLVSAADGHYAAKIDDDDIYAPHYLADQVNALRYSGADLVGKQASYLYLASMDGMLLRFPRREHRWTKFVAGPTLVAPVSTFRSVPFESRTRGEDSTLLKTLALQGGRIYSADRFNFVQMRVGHNHTWQSEDLEFLANSDYVTSGFCPQHAIA